MNGSAFIQSRVKTLVLVLLITGLSLANAKVSAAEEGEGKALDPLCPDAEVWSGKLITDICWGCLFPIRIAGGAWGDGEVPDGVTDKILCACDSPTGIPELGLTLGLWSPARLIEIVRNPWCAPALGGAVLNESAVSRLRLLGTAGHAEYDASETSFYNYHYYAFPLYILLDLFWDDRCNADGYRDFDLLYVSELDPTWSNDELAFFTNPEAVLFANPIAVAACAVDGVAATAGHPIDEMFWCAGTWGHLYPLSGVAYTSAGTDLRISSLLATRATAALHRRGLAWKTVGNDALCGGNIYPFMPKNQYRMSLFYPVAETDRTHAIGESTYRWGSGKTYPGPGEDHVYLLWRWQDCCAGI